MIVDLQEDVVNPKPKNRTVRLSFNHMLQKGPNFGLGVP